MAVFAACTSVDDGGGEQSARVDDGAAAALRESTPVPAAQFGSSSVDDRASPELVCQGQVCAAGEQCCSCRVSASSPLVSFCHTPDFCPHGSICTIPPP